MYLHFDVCITPCRDIGDEGEGGGAGHLGHCPPDQGGAGPGSGVTMLIMFIMLIVTMSPEREGGGVTVVTAGPALRQR